MGRLRTTLVLAGAIGATGFAAYRLLLTDDAREHVEMAASAVRTSVERIMTVMDDVKGHEMREDVLPNREATIADWEALGY